MWQEHEQASQRQRDCVKRPGEALSRVARSVRGHSTVTQRPLASLSYTHAVVKVKGNAVPGPLKIAGEHSQAPHNA